MPQIPHPISGTIKDTDDSTVVSGATVTVYDKDAGGSSSDTTDANGSYIVDLANLTNLQGVSVSYTQGNTITVEAVSGNKIKQYRLTVSGDEQEQDIN